MRSLLTTLSEAKLLRARIARLREDGRSYSEIARLLDIKKATVAYHCRRLGHPPDRRAARRYDWQAVQASHDAGMSVRDLIDKYGFSSASWHKAVLRGEIRPRPAHPTLEELLVQGRRTHRSHLRERIIREGLKKDECERCGTSEWLGKPLSPQLHHVNGDGLDNRLENLQLLCPNCHAQTDNWGGRNRGRSRPAAAG